MVNYKELFDFDVCRWFSEKGFETVKKYVFMSQNPILNKIPFKKIGAVSHNKNVPSYAKYWNHLSIV